MRAYVGIRSPARKRWLTCGIGAGSVGPCREELTPACVSSGLAKVPYHRVTERAEGT